jgi:hypothetical protein
VPEDTSTADLRTPPGVDPAAVAGFVAALADASARLAGITRHLEAARVHDEAFGRLIDAAKVRDAYHQRLPATEHNLDEARSVIDRFVAEFGGAPTVSAEPAPAPEGGAL